MKFLHEMMPIFRTEFSEFPRKGLDHTLVNRGDGLETR
jgi:hypothetical protein